MEKIEIDCLKSFFSAINERFSYVVTRNGDELPLVNESNDIDILINQNDYFNFDYLMKEKFKEFGFNRLERTSFHGIECYTFYNIQRDIPISIKIDLFFNYEGGGVLYYKFTDIIKYKVKNKNDVFVFDPKIESYLTAFKTLAAGGKLKVKYLQNFLRNNIESDFSLLMKSPSKTIAQYLNYIITHKTNPDSVNRKKIIKETLIQNFLYNPLKAITRFFNHYLLEFKRAFNKRFFIVFVGPDGSGKTTFIDKLKSDSKSVFKSDTKRFEVCHHRPHVLPNISEIFNKELNEKEVYDLNFNPHSAKPSGIVLSFVKLCYYTIDYLLGYFLKIIKFQRSNKFIIFDRYYYDFIVDQKRSALMINKSLTLFFYKLFVPKPNIVFFIKVDAQKAHDRKKELPVDSILEINKNYEYLSSKMNNFETVINDNLIDSYNHLRTSFIKIITTQI